MAPPILLGHAYPLIGRIGEDGAGALLLMLMVLVLVLVLRLCWMMLGGPVTFAGVGPLRLERQFRFRWPERWLRWSRGGSVPTRAPQHRLWATYVDEFLQQPNRRQPVQTHGCFLSMRVQGL